jgi:hypothetical protein
MSSSTESLSPNNASNVQKTNQTHPLDRLRQLEQLYLNREYYYEAFSHETLLDTLVCLYDECCNSTLRKDKSISEFVEFAGHMVVPVQARRLELQDPRGTNRAPRSREVMRSGFGLATR